MPKKTLDKAALGQFEDWLGNNAAVRCPVCANVFIVSGFIAKGQRKCPTCQKTTAQITPDEVTIDWPDNEHELTVLTRKELDDGRLEECVRLVSQGGAVDYRSIEDKLPRAETIALIEHDEQVIAVAAIKSPRPGYAQTLTGKTNYRLAGDLPELGYVAVACEWRGLGLSTKVVQKLLSTKTSWALFATTSSPQMKRTLRKNGFRQVGKEYPDKSKKSQLSLWVRDDRRE